MTEETTSKNFNDLLSEIKKQEAEALREIDRERRETRRQFEQNRQDLETKRLLILGRAFVEVSRTGGTFRNMVPPDDLPLVVDVLDAMDDRKKEWEQKRGVVGNGDGGGNAAILPVAGNEHPAPRWS